MVTIHDLAFIIHPECAVPSVRDYLLRVTSRAVRRADRIIAVSQRTADGLVNLMGASKEKNYHDLSLEWIQVSSVWMTSRG